MENRSHNESRASGEPSPLSSSNNSRSMPKFEVSAVDEDDVNTDNVDPGPPSSDAAEGASTSGKNRGVVMIKSIDDVAIIDTTSAVSPFIVSLPSEEGY